MGLTTFESYEAANAALVILVWLPSFLAFFCSLCMVRRRKDPARTAFTYLKAALAFFVVFCFFDICGDGFSIAYSRSVNDDGLATDSDDVTVRKALLRAQVHCYNVASLFDSFTDIFVLFVLLRISIGIIIVKNNAVDKLGKILKFASYGVAVALAALAITHFAITTRFYNEFYDDRFFRTFYTDDDLVANFTKARQVDFSFRVLVFVLALLVLARAVMIKLETKLEQRVATASTFLIACAVLWLLRTAYNMASIASYTNLADARKDPNYANRYEVLDAVLGVWPQFVLLVLAFTLGVKKSNGLWSTEQPFMMTNPLPGGGEQTAWGYNYDASHNMTPPVQLQQHSQQQPQMQTGWQQQQQAYYPPPQQQQQVPQQYAAQYGAYNPENAQTSEDTMGLNHQANGSPPIVTHQPYNEKP
ncbi:hypothetical protein G7046_g2498 [Stylonectria norvegica]|nr:hypothetical protein G7046_g2498 [Stylonectria norvegica]